MRQKRTTRRTQRTAPQIARLRQIRDRYQRERPSLDSLVASGEFADPIKQGECFSVLELAAALKRARQAKRLSLAQVATRSGIDKAAISRIETGQNLNPTIATLESIARAIGGRLRLSLDNVRV